MGIEQISHARQQFLAKLEEWLKLLQELNQQTIRVFQFGF